MKVPSFFKSLIRFFYYKEERERFFREPKIKHQQNELIKQYDKDASKVILFLIPGADRETGIDKISGGIISIVSICEESVRLKDIHKAEVLMSTFPDEFLLAKHSQFNNQTPVLRYQQLSRYFTRIEEIQIHLPEFMCAHFIRQYEEGKFQWLNNVKKLTINILNQNIILMPRLEHINWLKRLAKGSLTITTAHQQYCTSEYRTLYDTPLHKFSVWISPEKYSFKTYNEKENLIVVSPDEHPMKERILKYLSTVDALKIQIIRNLTYEDYKATISRAKWVLTFGEGLDGYIIESVFSGAVGFAVFNKDFFTSDFEGIPTIYKSYEELEEKIIADIVGLDHLDLFMSHQKRQFDLCARYYSQVEYSDNIKSFYLKHYTYS